MPLLNKKPFVTEPPPPDLDENEEIFVCRQTNEVFRDYELFFKRTILCNSLVWSCEVTAKHNLTYEEAVDCENDAKTTANSIPLPIQRGALTLAHYTRHSRLDHLCDEVCAYIRDRFQEGEEVDVKYNDAKYVGFIHNVIEPPLTNGYKSPKSGKSPKIKSPKPSSDDIITIPDDDNQKIEHKSPRTSTFPDAKTYQYQIKIKNYKNHGVPEMIIVKQPKISRKKGAFSREKLRLLLRVTCYRTSPTHEDGYWKVNDEYRQKFDLSADVDQNVFVPTKNSKKRKETTEMADKKSKKRKKSSSSEVKEKDIKKMTADEIVKMKKQKVKEKEEQKKMREADKETKKKERDKARLEKQEVLKEQKMFLLQWCAPQEDLDLTDLRELPASQPIQCLFPGDMFSNMVMVLEFLQIFGEFFDIRNDFSDGVTFDMLSKALTEHDAEGIFYDIIRFLLDNILKIHAEEEEEEGLDDAEFPKETLVESNEEQSDCDMNRLNKAVSASATMAASWAQLHQGRNLHELNLDPFTLSEILRLHFLSSGANLLSGTDGETYRWQRRGGFTISDDAGVEFRHNEHNIMRGLVTDNIYELPAKNKLKIITTLSSQLLTYATTRDIIEDGFDRWRKARRELQEIQWADQRKDKEEAALKVRKIKEERAKAKEERVKEKERKMAEIKEKKTKTKETAKVNAKEDNSKENEQGDIEMFEDKALTRSQGRVLDDGMIVNKMDKEEYEREERKETLRKNEKSYYEELRRSQAMSSVQPLGCDRIFRRYWIFNSINGLFIEETDTDYEQLLKPSLKELKDEEPNDEGSCDDDDDDDDDSMSDSFEEDASSNATAQECNNQEIACLLTKEQIKEEKELCRILKLYAIPLECLPDNSPLTRLKKYEKRSANIANTKPSGSQWSYVDKKEVLDQLLNTLNPRGHRERLLRENIVQHYDTIVNGLEGNPVSKDQSFAITAKDIPKRGRRRQSQAVDKTLYKTMEDFIEANLRDQILDLENRIYHAAFGVVKVPDISVWRKEVENDIYKFLPDDTKAEGNEAQLNGDDTNMMNGTDQKGDEKMDIDLMVEDVVVSRPGTPIDGSFISTPTSSLTPQTINPCVRLLAKVVLQLEESIERKYLIPPLGDDEETKKRKMQEAAEAAVSEFNEMMNVGKKKKTGKTPDENENNDNNSQNSTKDSTKTQKTLLERWRGSLLSSTNLSQVFIHLNTLDNSIAWDKSVLNAHCRICRRKGDAEFMLLCDGCDRGHHMYCLKPPIKEIPEGDWFCEICRPKETRRSIRKVCRKNEESENEEEDYDTKRRIEEAESDDSSESESEEESDVEEGKEENSDEEGSIHMETCACCDGEGELLCCETCPLAFHLECAYPPLRRIPRGDWVCQVCTGSENELPSGRRVKKSVIKEAQKKSKDVTPPVTKKVKIPARKKDAKTTTTNKRQSTNTTPKTATSSRAKKTPTTSLNQSKATPVTSKQGKSTPSTAQNTKSKATPTTQSSTPSDETPKTKWTTTQIKKCGEILKELQNHEDAILFIHPVDVTEVPDYHLIIKTPMDFKTIQTKLSSREYNTTEEFIADIRQIFFNCAEYNKPRSREARAGIRLSAFFETRCAELGLDPTEPSVPRTRRSK